MKLRRRHHKAHKPRHKHQSAAAHKAGKQTNAIVSKLKHDLTTTHAGAKDRKAVTHSVTDLRRTIHSVGQDVKRHGAGRHTKLVSSALGDLDHSLATMAQGFAATDPQTKLKLLAHAKQALDRAEHKARRAGDDWPL